jgi:hypothetical protein
MVSIVRITVFGIAVRIAPIYLSFDSFGKGKKRTRQCHGKAASTTHQRFECIGAQVRTRKPIIPLSRTASYFLDVNNNEAKVLHFPRHSPNDVRHVELETPCGQQSLTPYHDGKTNRPLTPDPSFHTIDECLYPLAERSTMMFTADRRRST